MRSIARPSPPVQKTDGASGPRPLYGEPYDGCFVYDPDGHKIEAAFWAGRRLNGYSSGGDMQRHYFITDNLDDLSAVEHDLEARGVTTEQIHVLQPREIPTSSNISCTTCSPS